MRSYSVSYAKNNLSALLAAVRVGERLIIADRGLPVAVLVPASVALAGATDEALDRLARAGLVTPGAAAPPTDLMTSPPPAPSRGASAVAALLAERATGW